MAGLLIPQHGRRGVNVNSGGSGRPYPPAVRPPAGVAVIPRPNIKHSEIDKAIDYNLRQQREFKLRHEDVPVSFKEEYEALVASLEQEGNQNDED